MRELNRQFKRLVKAVNNPDAATSLEFSLRSYGTPAYCAYCASPPKVEYADTAKEAVDKLLDYLAA